jgi:hypothetical protein
MIPQDLLKAIGNLTQIERDKVIQWLAENRPDALRQPLRALGYMKRGDVR